MKVFLEKEKITSRLKHFFKENAARYYVDMAFLYGSHVRGFPHEGSDIDLGVVFLPEVKSPESIFSLLTDLSYELTKILRKEVNIISIDKDFRQPMLYYNAIILGIPAFVGNQDRFIDLKLEAIFQMEDFSIFGISWQKEIAEKNLKRGV